MASRGLGTLTLDLVARIGGFEQGMDKAARIADKRMREIEKRARAFGTAVGAALGVSITGALAGGVAAVGKAIDRMDELRDASIRLGIGVETLSAFGYAAQQTGTDIEALGNGLKILSKNAADALNPKSSKASIFEALGVEVKDAQGNLRQLEDLIPDIADAFRQLEDGTTKAALAQELFGKNGLALIEFLNQGGDGLKEMTDRARELGIVIDQEAADKADAFKDNLNDLKAAALGLATQVATDLLPDLIELTRTVVEWTREGSTAKTIANEISGAFKGLAEVASFLWNVFDTGAMTLKGVAYDLAAVYKVAEAVGKARVFDFDGARQAIEDAKEFRQIAGDASRQIGDNWDTFNKKFGEAAKTAQKTAQTFGQNFQIPGLGQQQSFSAVPTVADFGKPSIDRSALNNALGGVKPPAGGGGRKSSGKSDEEREAERLKSAYDSLNSSLEERIALFGKEGEAAKVRYDIEHGELAKLAPALQQELLAKAESLDLMKAEEEQMRKSADLAKKEAEEKLRGVEATAAQIDDMRLQLEMYRMSAKEQERMIALRYADVNATDEQRAAIASLSDQIHEAQKVSEGWNEVQRDLSDAFYNVAKDAKNAEDYVKGFFDSVADYILRSISEDWSEKIVDIFRGAGGGGATTSFLNPISGAVETSGGGSAGFWTSLIGAFFGGGRAAGGPVSSGMFYRVNENGPEMLSVGGSDYLMMGSRSGHVTPNPAMAGSGFSQTIVNNYRERYDARVEAQKAQKAATYGNQMLARNR